MISSKMTADPADMSLIFAGKILKDQETVRLHSIQEGFTIHMVLKPRPREQTTLGATSSNTTSQPTGYS